MSLVVRKLVLSPGGASNNSQPPTHHVTLSAYTHSRSNVSDTMGRVLDGPPSGSMNTAPSSSPYSSSSSSKHSSTYNLPFVLQDHNYGAPPPPTPPQSPPPVPSSSGSSLYHQPSHHLHQTNHQHNTQPYQPSYPHNPQSHISTQQNTNHLLHLQQKQQSHHPQQTISHVSSSPRLGIVTSSGPSVSVSGLLTSHPLNTMPPHRQQFMPHPKASIFPSPHIPPPPLELNQSPTAITGPPSSITGAETDDDSRLSDRSSSVGPSGEETETAPEGEGDEQPVDDSITRCVCDFSHDDGYMIQCDRCFVWQHVDCMEIDRENIPDEYLCEACDPRPIDRFKARALQIHRRQEIKAHLARLSSSDSDDNIPMSSKGRGSLGKVQERKVVKKKKVKQMKDMKNGRKGSVSLLKKSSIVTPCNNNIIPGTEDKERRMLVKRRRKSSSMSGGEGVSDDSSGGPVERLRAWVEGYEVAVTNHYSPELRARVHAARINGVSPDLRASTQGAVLGHRCKVVENSHPLFDVFDSKILVAATRLSVNTAITEFQGKYLLASQWNAQQPATGQPYLPYVLQYHMPKEGLTVCVDARTYGNDARFTRRSCRPNAEIRHVVERGSLHLYLVATRDIEEGEEVTLSLETANSNLELVCCLPEEHECHAPLPSKAEQTSPVPTPPHKKNGLILSKKTLKKQQLQLQLRTSKRTTSTESRNSDTVITPCVNSTPVTPIKQRRASGCGKSPTKSPSVSTSSSPEDSGKDSTLSTPPTATTTPEMPKVVDKQQQQKMTREERKIAAYMKAFERMEKAAQRRQEIEKKKEEDKSKDPKDKDKKRDGEEDDWEKTSSADESVRNMPSAERCRRKGKKGRGKGSPQKRSNHRVDSTASDLTGDESSCASVGLMSPVGGSIEGIALNISSPPQGNSNAMGFRFPKTKKALMNEWLNENVDPVHPGGNLNGVAELPAGVPTCYMRSPATPLRRSSMNQGVIQGGFLNLDMSGGSAKKRWLRQAISEETESPQLNGLCPSPNSRPDSPTGGGDYITPLKKRRLARESMSSELSSTPPSTPVHSTSLEEDKMIEEMEAELDEEAVSKIKSEDTFSEDHSYLLIQAEHTSGFHPTKDSIARIKRDIDEEENELIIEDDENFVDKGEEMGKNDTVCGNFQEDANEMKIKNAGENFKRNLIHDHSLKAMHSMSFTKAEKIDLNVIVKGRSEEVVVRKERKYQQGMKRERRHVVRSEQNHQQGLRRERRQGTKKGRSCQTEIKREKACQKAVKRKKGLKNVKREKCDYEIKAGIGKHKIIKEIDEKEVKDEIKQKIKKEFHKHVKKETDEQLIKKESDEQEVKKGTDIQEIKNEAEELEVKRENYMMDAKKETGLEIERVIRDIGVKICCTKPSENRKEDEQGNRKESQAEKTFQGNEMEMKKKKKKKMLKVVRNEGTRQNEKAKVVEQVEITNINFKLGNVKSESDKKVSKRGKSSRNSKNSKRVLALDQEQDANEEGRRENSEELVLRKETEDQVLMKRELVEELKIEKSQRYSSRRRLRHNLKEEKQVITRGKRRQILKKEILEQKLRECEVEKQEVQREERLQTDIKRVSGQPKGIKREKTEHLETKNENEQQETEAVQAGPLQVVGEETDSQSKKKGENVQQKTRKGVKEDQKIEHSQIKREEYEDQGNEDRNQDTMRKSIKVEGFLTGSETDPQPDSSLLLERSPPVQLKSGSPLDVSVLLPSQPRKCPEMHDEETKREGSRTPESAHPYSPELKGPRTPEGPAPVSPDDPTVFLESPRLAEPCQSCSSPVQGKDTERERTPEIDHISERPSRSRTRGPCTPPSPSPVVQEEMTEAELQEECDVSSRSTLQLSQQAQSKPAPAKRKLSILEYRKRKSVGSDCDSRGLSGPTDSSPLPSLSLTCFTVLPTHSTDSSVSSFNAINMMSSSTPSTSTQESSLSPTYFSSPSKLAQTEDGESPPDLALSPIHPFLLPPLSVVFESKSTKDEVKRDAESNCSSGGDSINDNQHNSKSSSVNVSSSCSITTVTTIAVTSNVFTTVNSTTVTTSAGVTASNPLSPITGNTTPQDVKWNAAPTLLERQRENLTARLRREFGLCVSDDDEDKSGLRLGCASIVGRPSPPLLPPPAPFVSFSSSPLSPRASKPSGLQPGPADGEDRDRNHRRHKDKNLPPPPPPPTAPPKNSIFQGREVTVQKVVCSSKVGAAQTGFNPVQNTNCSSTTGNNGGLINIPSGSTQRLTLSSYPGSSGTGITITGSYLGPPPPPVPPPTTSASRNGPSLQSSMPTTQGTTSTSGMASASVPGPLTTIGPHPVASPAPPSVPVVIQSKLSPISSSQPLGSTSPSLSHLPSSIQVGPRMPQSLTTTPQNHVYPARPYSRGQQYSTPPAGGVAPSAVSLYSSGRVGPPPHHNQLVIPPPPASIRPQESPTQGPPGLASPSLGYSGGGGYSGHDCSAPGSRGS
ncbi:uncharacterized protein upSET isoform X2 [Panulirus ornatus]|uniref:uncharacterized protein upSET isoform X2 n=2 Tax=Panulirus ornatus TaxID=150431 RepID=UPI003A8C1987